MVSLLLKGGVKVSNILYLSKLLQNKEITSVELTQKYFEAIKQVNPSINAFVSLNEENAINQAKLADAKFLNNENVSPLCGIPMSLKDNLAVENMNTTCCSKALQHFKSTYTATAVKNLFNNNAVLLGKNNMDEFAMGSACNSGIFGSALNPYDTTKSPGGSSGGSAAAVASGISVYSLGTDTAGSVRQPSSFCGVVGLKPTYGSVSRYGLLALASSFDQISPITSSIKDCAIIFDAIKGYDKNDMTSLKRDYNPTLPQITGNIKGTRIGISKKLFENCSESVSLALDNAVKTFKSLGAVFVDIELPHFDYALPVYYILGCAEISSNFGRFDGIRFGNKTDLPYKDIDDMIAKTRTQVFGDDVKRRIMLGIHFLSTNNYKNYFLKANKLRNEIVNDFNLAYQKCDFILSPTAPTTAFSIDYKPSNVVEKYKADSFVVSANICGFPALSLPCGKDSQGLPIGMQLMGPNFSEGILFNAGFAFERNTCIELSPSIGGIKYDI